jgi:hypothetical protein
MYPYFLRVFGLFLVPLLLGGCFQTIDEPSQPSPSRGFRPVYANPDSLKTIAFTAARGTQNAGKIYLFGSYLFQVETGKGIHLIDNSNPLLPRKVGFYFIPLASEIAIKSGFLYTNNLDDLVVLDIRNPLQVTVSKRIPNAFPAASQVRPQGVGAAFFECPDPSKGVVIDWVPADLNNPKCRTNL